MNRLFRAILGVSLGTGSLAFADITFNTPANTDLGTTHTFVLNGANIVATGYNHNGSVTDLFAKSDGSGESGLGLNSDPSGDHEIWFKGESKDFVQLDVTDALNQGFTNFQFKMDSTTLGEQWEVSACATAGVLCSNPSSIIGSGEGTFIAVPSNLSLSRPYLDFISFGCIGGGTACGDDNVLVSALTDTPGRVPEPDSIVLLSTVVLGLAGFAIRRKRLA
jgi:hypothetical protein